MLNVQMYRYNPRKKMNMQMYRQSLGVKNAGGPSPSPQGFEHMHTERQLALPSKVRGGFQQEVKLEPSLKVGWDVTWQNWKARVFQEATGLGRHPRARELQEGGRSVCTAQRPRGREEHQVLKVTVTGAKS